MRRLFKLLIPIYVWLLAPLAQAEVSVSGRHIYVMFPGVDALWGSYLFVVTNSGTQPERLAFPVMLPSETIDFQGQENVRPEDLKLGEGGKLILDKEFPPGDSMVNIGFKIPAGQGKAAFTVTPQFTLDALSLFVWENTLKVTGDNLLERKGVPFSGRNYDTYTVSEAAIGKPLTVTIGGVPEGRGRLWIVGGILGAVLLVGLGFAYLSRPHHAELEDVA